MPSLTDRLSLRLRSFVLKLAAAGLIFAIVPVLLYQRFGAAEAERNALLLRLVQDQGRFAGEAVAPLLDRFSPREADRLAAQVNRLAAGGLSVKVLFRPAIPGPAHFLLVASAPETGAEQARAAMARLVASGVLASLDRSCAGNAPLALRLPAASASSAGGELLTYLAPHATRRGCWVILAAQPAGTLAERTIGRPYWRMPEVRLAAAIYLLMAVLVLSIFTDAGRNLRRFRNAARALGRGEPDVSFVAGNRVPELAEAAAEFDAMVATLRRAEGLLRQAAEENAHALKGPLAVISQSLEPLRRAIPPDEVRAQRSLEIIAQSVERMDGLVAAVRRIDETIANLIDRPRRRVDLSALLERLGQGYARLAAERSVGLDLRLAPGLVVTGSEDLLETIAENLLDNALDYAPPGSRIGLDLHAEGDGARLCVLDQGPGVAEGELGRIFDRHQSRRPKGADEPDAHYGLGLWLVRRNAEAMGGRAWAGQGPDGGLVVSVSLPLAR